MHRLRRAPRQLRRSDDGASAVEFALISIPLFLLLFGIVAVGLALFAQITAQQVAREAARVAAVGGFTSCAVSPTTTPNDAALTNFIRSRQTGTITSVRLTRSDANGDGTITPGDRVVVTYTYPTNSGANSALKGITGLIPGGSVILPNTLSVKADSRIEVVQGVASC